MERIRSRKNESIRRLRLLAADGAFRRQEGLYLCDGIKTMRDALSAGARICDVLWKEQEQFLPGLPEQQTVADEELFDYVSPLKNSPGPLFTVKIEIPTLPERPERILVLENVQDPGNVGTVIRSANAFGIDAVILCGDCADLYHPRTVRATMGAIFRQKVLNMSLEELDQALRRWELPLWGAALRSDAVDLRRMSLGRSAVAVGSEGRGLSEALLRCCEKTVIIPMRPESESLNAAVAASLIMWEMVR